MTYQLRFTLLLTDPNGTEWDLTDRIDEGSIGNLTEEVEEDLTQITHPDLDLVLDDYDGLVTGIFRGATRGQIFEVIVLRETGRRRPQWERVFAGIVDIPQGLRFDRKDKTAALHCFGYSKYCELFSAETLVREFAGRTCTTTSGSASLTFSDTTNLAANDVVQVQGSSATEEVTIYAVTGGTTATATTNASASISAGDATLLTPYYRNYSVSSLATLLMAEADISDVDVDISQTLATTPFPSTLNDTGLPGGYTPAGLLEQTSNISVYVNAKRYDSDGVTDDFADQGADAAKCDWRPYETTEPGTLRAASTWDDGRRAWDYAGGDYYDLNWSGNTLQLRKNGVSIATVATKSADDVVQVVSLDWDEVNNYIWVSYAWQDWNALGDYIGETGATKRYDSAGTQIDVVYGQGGYVRAVRALSSVLVYLGNDYPQYPSEPEEFRFNRLAMVNATTLVETQYDLPDGILDLWTARVVGDHLCCVRNDGTLVNQNLSGATKSHAIVWTTADGVQVADHFLIESVSAVNYGTLWDNAAALDPPYYVCYAGGDWFVLSTEFSGVVPYADFEGMSCARAMRALAVLAGAHFMVDDYKTARIWGRDVASITGQDAVEIPTPLDQTEMPVWEWLRTGVAVTGKTEADADVEVRVGETGDSAQALEVDVELPLTEGLASALANTYHDYLSETRTQFDETIEEPESGPVRVLQLVERDGHRYIVARVSSDLEERTQQVQLVEDV